MLHSCVRWHQILTKTLKVIQVGRTDRRREMQYPPSATRSDGGQKSSLHEVRRTCRTSTAKIRNVRGRTAVKFTQMSDEKVKMSGEAQKNFVYTENQSKPLKETLRSLVK